MRKRTIATLLIVSLTAGLLTGCGKSADRKSTRLNSSHRT